MAVDCEGAPRADRRADLLDELFPRILPELLRDRRAAELSASQADIEDAAMTAYAKIRQALPQRPMWGVDAAGHASEEMLEGLVYRRFRSLVIDDYRRRARAIRRGERSLETPRRSPEGEAPITLGDVAVHPRDLDSSVSPVERDVLSGARFRVVTDAALEVLESLSDMHRRVVIGRVEEMSDEANAARNGTSVENVRTIWARFQRKVRERLEREGWA